MIERFREWYELYFPELSKKFEDHEKFIKAVLEKPKEEWMKELGLERSMGGEIDEMSKKILMDFAERIKSMYEFRKELQEYIKNMMEKYAPNVTAIAGPLVGARLIALAGGLKELAFLPASTIQVLGAEKALFKHLTRNTPPPKHGVLFNHPYVQKLPKKLRGRMARTLAAKIAIAAKVDAFGHYYIGDKLKKEIDKRFEELKREWEEGKISK
jgi:nucleolar protein 56